MPDIVDYKYRFSSIKTYTQCPALYKASPPFSIASSKACDRGTVVHEAIEVYLSTGRQPSTLYDNHKNVIDGADLPLGLMVEQRLAYGDHGGTVDGLYISEDLKTVVVYDWKTGKSKANEEQLLHYCWLAYKNYPALKKFEACFVYLDQKKHYSWFEFTLMEVLEYESRYASTMQNIQESELLESWPERKSWKCVYCSLKTTCEEFKSAAPQRI